MNKVQELTTRELSIAERKAGVGLATLEDPNALGKLDLLAALAWVLDKRENPGASYDEWLDKSPQEVTDFLGINDEEEGN